MKTVNCAHCDNDKSDVVVDLTGVNDYYLDYLKIDYDNTDRNYVKCTKCGLIYRKVVLDESQKKRMYAQFRDASLSRHGVSLKKETQAEYFEHMTQLPPGQSDHQERVEFVTDVIGRQGVVLDIGCGGGVFLHRFKKKHPTWKALGVEPTKSKYFSDVAAKSDISIVNEYLNKDTFDIQFDLITIIHVLEHVEDHRTILSQINDYLRDDGLLYVEVPSSDDIGVLPVEHDRYMCIHDFIFSLDVLETLLKEQFEIIYSGKFISPSHRNQLRALVKRKN